MCAQGTVTLGADTPKGQHWLWRLQGKRSVGTYTQEYMEGITSATAYFSNKTETWDLSEIWHNVAKSNKYFQTGTLSKAAQICLGRKHP